MRLKSFCICACLLALGGCLGGSLKAYGVGRQPVYALPDEPAFTDAEKARLIAFNESDPILFGKIYGQYKAYREIVLKHNEWATKINRQILQDLGYTDEELKEMGK